MKGFFRMVLTVVLVAIAFIAGMSYYQSNHSYVNDSSVNWNLIVDDSEERISDFGNNAVTLFDDICQTF